MNDLTEQYRREFYQEAREILERVNDDLLRLEAEPDNATLINSLFRGMHTIKGSAGSFELHDISAFTHHLEGLLNALRDGRLDLSSEMVDVLLAGADQIILMIDAHETGSEPAEADTDIVKRIGRFLSADTPAEAKEMPSLGPGEGPAAAAETPVERPGQRRLNTGDLELPAEIVQRLEKAFDQGLNVFRVDLNWTSELLENGYAPVVLLQNIRAASSVYHAAQTDDAVPALDVFEPLALYLLPVLYIAISLDEEAVADLAFDPSLLMVSDLTLLAESGKIPGMTDAEAMQEFLEGAVEWVETMEQAAIRYESTGDEQALNEIFRTVHNIKGDSDFIGLTELAVFSHAFENMLDRLRSGKLRRSEKWVDVILQSIDHIRGCIRALGKREALPPTPAIFSELSAFMDEGVQTEIRDRPALLPDADTELRNVFTEQLLQYNTILSLACSGETLGSEQRVAIRRTFNSLLHASSAVGHKTLHELAEKGVALFRKGSGDLDEQRIFEMVGKIRSYLDGLWEGPKRLGEILVAEGKLRESELAEVLELQKPIGAMLVEARKVSEKDVAAALEKQDLMETARQVGQTAAETGVRTMRVDERKVEQFTNTIGEMLIARNTYAYLLEQLEKSEDDARNTVKALKENLHLFSRLTNDVHHGVMALRMIPIRNIFQKFNRVVRDISRKQKKFIQLVTDGEDIEIDKKVADMLSEPMVHLVRNACDHGIESPVARKKAGKPEKATVLLRASREGSNLCIRILDDGKGIDRQKLFENAKKRGLAVDAPKDPAVLDLIFMPGLSTVEEVTDLSGRGVGMDVVKTTVQSLGGNVSVSTQEGQGTEIVLTLPTSLGIDTVLFIESGNEAYALPIDHIVETIKLPGDRIRRAGDQRMFHHRGEVLAVHRLKELLGLKDGGSGNGALAQSQEELSMVVVRSGRGKFAIIVDRLDKNMEIAVRPAPDVFSSIDVVSGVSILGDGKVMLVLNPEKL